MEKQIVPVASPADDEWLKYFASPPERQMLPVL
jgi:hypothetical protein